MFGWFKKKKKEYKYVLYDDGILFTYKQTIFDTYDEARSKARFKSSIYKIPADIVDIILKKEPFYSEWYVMDHKDCKLVFIGSNDQPGCHVW